MGPISRFLKRGCGWESTYRLKNPFETLHVTVKSMPNVKNCPETLGETPTFPTFLCHLPSFSVVFAQTPRGTSGAAGPRDRGAL